MSFDHDGRRLVLFLLAGVNFLITLDITIINVALPAIDTTFQAGGVALQWLVSGYILTYAICLLSGGRVGDRFGADRVLIYGLVVFAVGSALCGFALTMPVLQAGRVVQGVGAALVSPQAMALAHRIFQGRARATAFAVFGLVAGLASVLGPLVGGWLVDQNLAGLGWRPIFLINPPLALLLMVLLWRSMPPVVAVPSVHFDPVAVILAAIGVFLCLFPLIEGRVYGWPFWIWGMLVIAVPVFAALIGWEHRQMTQNKAQLVPVILISAKGFWVFCLAIGLFFAGLPGFFMMLSIFLQTGFGFTPLQSGLTSFPLSLGIIIASILAPMMQQVSPRLRIVAGALITLVGLGALRVFVPAFAGLTDQGCVMALLLVAGLGFGTVIGPLFHLALDGIGQEQAGIASALLQTFQQLGGVLGVALTGSVFFARLTHITDNNWRMSLASGLSVTLGFFTVFLLFFVLWSTRQKVISQ